MSFKWREKPTTILFCETIRQEVIIFHFCNLVKGVLRLLWSQPWSEAGQDSKWFINSSSLMTHCGRIDLKKKIFLIASLWGWGLKKNQKAQKFNILNGKNTLLAAMCIVLSFVIICVSLMSFRQLTLKLTLKDSLDESSCIFVCHMLTAFSMKGAKGGKTFKSRARNDRCALSIYQKILRVSKNISKKFHHWSWSTGCPN